MAEHDPRRFSRPSPPLPAWDGADPVSQTELRLRRQSGDIRYWGVCWACKPFESYHAKIGRFMFENRFQSFRSLRSMREFCTQADHDLFSELLRAHQRSRIGKETIRAHLAEACPAPEGFSQFNYVIQVLQAHGGAEVPWRRIACEFRIAWALCFGRSTIAGRGPRGAASTITGTGGRCITWRDAFAGILGTFCPEGDAPHAWVVNDCLTNSYATSPCG